MLVTAAALLVWPALWMLLSPRLVARRTWSLRFPRLALATWCVVLGTGVASVVASLVVVLVAARQMAAQGPAAALTCAQVCHGVLVIVAGWCLVALVGGVAGLVLCRSVPLFLGRHRTRGEVELACRDAAPIPGLPVTSGPRVLQVASREVIAASVPGRRPVIMVSTGLQDALTPDELGSVIAHERSHLRQRHGVLAQLAHLQLVCAPRLPCAQALERSVLLLIELAADDRAARSCGRPTTASALAKVGALGGDPALRLRADRLARRVPAAGGLGRSVTQVV